MIKLSGSPIVEGYNKEGARLVRVSLWADTEDEMTGVTTGENIEGLKEDDVLTMGSTVLTIVDLSLGRLGSNGIWKF